MHLLYSNILNLTLKHNVIRYDKFLKLMSTTVRRKASNKYTKDVPQATASEFRMSSFKGIADRWNGVTVMSEEESCKPEEFSQKLQESLKQWIEEKKRGIWFKVALSNVDWVPELAKEGFKFHHASENFVMMYKWLPSEEYCNLPPYAHTMIGVGGVVINDKNQILLVNERYYYHKRHWKLPGGYVDPGENLVDAAIREVFEETNIKTEFETVLTFRHGHSGMYDCSDIYAVIGLKPLTTEIQKSDREIIECKWMDMDEYVSHPHITPMNRLFITKYFDYKKHNIKIECTHAIHQIFNKPYTMYHAIKEK